jgi:urease accessory protein
MSDSKLLLRVLQDGDSFFPSGAVSFSWGLEMLCAEGAIASERDVEAFVLAHLHRRWAQFDRPVAFAAAVASNAFGAVAKIDQIVEAQTLAAELRSGSRRNGTALLSVHARLETPGAQDYLRLVQQGEAKGHLAPMQGFLWSRRGIPAHEIAILSAHTMCIGLLGAAVRIGVIGHVGAQRILKETHGDITAIAETRPADLDQIHAFMPQAEISSMRHELAQVRLFAN